MELLIVIGLLLLVLAVALYITFKFGAATEIKAGAEKQIEAVKDAKDIRDKVSKLDGLAVHDRLRGWRR